MTGDEILEAQFDGDGDGREDALMEQQAIDRAGEAAATPNRPGEVAVPFAAWTEALAAIRDARDGVELGCAVEALEADAQPAPVPSHPSSEAGRDPSCPLLVDLAAWVDAGEDASDPIHAHLWAPNGGPGHPGCGGCQLAVLRFRDNQKVTR